MKFTTKCITPEVFTARLGIRVSNNVFSKERLFAGISGLTIQQTLFNIGSHNSFFLKLVVTGLLFFIFVFSLQLTVNQFSE